MQKNNLNVVKERYKMFIKSYGIYPILFLLKEYEDKQDFRECTVIYESITGFISEIKSKNKKISKDLNIPTHLNQITEELFHKLELHKSDKFLNTHKYTKEIKKTIEKIYNDL